MRALDEPFALRLTPHGIERPRARDRSARIFVRERVRGALAALARFGWGSEAPLPMPIDEFRELRGTAGVLDEAVLK